jgi:molybdenum cofactor cytidylyltransferase
MICALIPAAGKSSRMGRPKLLLRLGKRLVIEHVIHTLGLAGIDKVLCVTSPELTQLAAVVRGAGAAVLQLAQPTAHMRQTVEQGLDWIERTWALHPDDSLLLVPADHPTLDIASVTSLMVARGQNPQVTIFVPTYQGKRGHPTLIDWKHVSEIRSLPADEGLNRYLRQHPAETLEVAVNHPGVIWDLDTPEDYERLQSAIGYRQSAIGQK